MRRARIVTSLQTQAASLGTKVDGTEWYLFGSAERNDPNATDIDLIILCKDHAQADALRGSIDIDALALPIHLSLLTFEEEAEINATQTQNSKLIFP